jgi:hypothetical protein
VNNSSSPTSKTQSRRVIVALPPRRETKRRRKGGRIVSVLQTNWYEEMTIISLPLILSPSLSHHSLASISWLPLLFLLSLPFSPRLPHLPPFTFPSPLVQRLSVRYLYDKLPGIKKTEFSLSFKLSSTQLELYRTFLDAVSAEGNFIKVKSTFTQIINHPLILRDALKVSRANIDEEEMDLQQREVESLKEIQGSRLFTSKNTRSHRR